MKALCGTENATRPKTAKANQSWTKQYGQLHRWVRLEQFPAGMRPPVKVRIYSRRDHFILNWWEPSEVKNRSEKVVGDLLSAMTRARQIDERLMNFRSSGLCSNKRLSHPEIVEKYLADLQNRADAGEIDVKTVARYRAALQYYLSFCAENTLSDKYRYVSAVDRDFRLAFQSYLQQCQVAGNGRNSPIRKRMKGQAFILDTVRSMFQWANDPERGKLLPEGFRNPFLGRRDARSIMKGDPFAPPDITLNMIRDLIQKCDHFQFRIFVPLIFFGLRAAEPCFLFYEYIREGAIQVPCNPELGIRTKGRTDKRFALLEEMEPCWELLFSGSKSGLLYTRRSVFEGKECAPLQGASMERIITEFQLKSHKFQMKSQERNRVRDRILHEAGALNYDSIVREFQKIAISLSWPKCATLKDLRHFFATTMHNAAMPEIYRSYLMGHSPGRSAIIAYTHLNELKRHYRDAVQKEWSPLIEAANRRAAELQTGINRVRNSSISRKKPRARSPRLEGNQTRKSA